MCYLANHGGKVDKGKLGKTMLIILCIESFECGPFVVLENREGMVPESRQGNELGR